jgi:chemotaxis response regulator CheB
MPPVKTHTLVLGIADAMAAAHLRRQISDHPRFDLVGTADNAVKTLYLVEDTKPAVVLMADDSPGLRGRDVLADIAAVSRDTLVIITTPGDPDALRGKPGVAESVHCNDIDAIHFALDNLADFLDHPPTRQGPNRRHFDDRRIAQDWSKVFAERRLVARRS